MKHISKTKILIWKTIKNKCGLLPGNQDKHILNVLFPKYLPRAIIQRIFFKRIRWYIAIAMTIDYMGKKFKLGETENIFSEIMFYSYRKKKEIPNYTLKSHYGYIFTTFIGERWGRGSVPLFLAVLMKIHKPDGIQ